MDLYQAAFLLGTLVCTATQPPTIIPELTCATGEGQAYRGMVAVTESGKTCQRWSDQTPHEHNRTPEKYPNKGLENNYCRNPDEGERPWCYTTDPDTRWEHCNVPSCGKAPEPGECMHCNGEDYRGTISTTKKGFTCQRWDSQEPHEHIYNPSNHPEMNLEENYCRNPSEDQRPWCYTTNSSMQWDYCSIPRCTSEPPTVVPELNCMSDLGRAYRGTIAVTESGKTCQKWSAQSPHTHKYSPGFYPCKGLESNYCRNPDNWSIPWCYTTDPRTRWEYCRVPSCDNAPKTEECIYCNGESYRGTKSTTENGFTCQGWNFQKPHSHLYPPGAYPEKYLEENYCRNPSGDPRPWCYTTNKSKRWDYCSIPHCSNDPPTIIPELSCATGKGKAYRGTIAVTESGQTCQRWSDQTPHEHNRTPENYTCKDLESNYCRNPDDQMRPWCYTTDPKVRWEYCSVPSCGNSSTPDEEEECMHCNGENYRGKISTTRRGYTCQRWDSQGPHEHGYYPKNYSEHFLEKNYCRNPSGDPWPWCYTTNPDKRWDYCSIPRCSSEPPTIVPEVTCMTGKGQAYRGTIAVTESGKTCQWWSSQRPKSHDRTPDNYPCGGLDRNYCRNPDNEKRPWYYTTEPNSRWEYCNVPSCGNSSSPDTDLLTPQPSHGFVSSVEP